MVGAGLAGAQTLAALRRDGFDGHVTLVGGEGVAPYDRPPLSKELLSRSEPAWLSSELGVRVEELADVTLLDDPAARLEPSAGSVGVVLGSGRTVTADAVVLATGSTPVRPPGWGAATVLHTARDAAALRAHVSAGRRLVIVGAGWIGAEVAGVAAGAGCDVTVVETAGTPLSRQLGEVVGAHLARWYAEAGVRLVTGSQVTSVDDGGARLADGRQLPADVVLAAVGARPATAWLAGALPLDARGAVTVDRTGRLVVPADAAPSGAPLPPGADRIWAVGDCATREHPVFGLVPGGHWSAALHDPEVTVRALLAGGHEDGPATEPVAAHAPYVFSRQLGHDLTLFGTPSPTDDVVLRGDPRGGASGHEGWTALYLDPTTRSTVRRARAILVVDAPREVGAVRRLMNRDVPVDLDLTVATDLARRLRDAVV